MTKLHFGDRVAVLTVSFFRTERVYAIFIDRYDRTDVTIIYIMCNCRSLVIVALNQSIYYICMYMWYGPIDTKAN
jgi:hypothetical protein